MKNSKEVSFITISDIHHGAKPVDEFEKEFYEGENSFFSILSASIEDPDFIGIAITGDYYDLKLSMEDSKSKLASKVFLDIFNLCKEYDKHFVVLRGTYSHDFRQLDHFKSLEMSYSKFRLVNSVEVIEFGSLKTLCIPEEYMPNQDEFYSEYFKDSYDLILGHGLFKYNCFDENSAEKTMAVMPLFDETKIMKISPLTIFGHVHTHSSYKNKIYYNGSFSRLCHGEEDPKGFLYTTYNLKTKKHEVTFVENDFAPTYVTIAFEKMLNVKEELDFEVAVKTILKYKKKYDNLKIKISKKTTMTYPSQVELIKNYFASKTGIQIECTLLSIKNKETLDENVINVEAADEEDLKYNFLLEHSSVYEKILQFIKVKHPTLDVSIELEDIKEALSNDS